jgi:anaerobic C4-dicarboxylate transporter
MELSVRRDKKRTFRQRFTRGAIEWGIPMVCLECVGIPMFGWFAVLVMVVPATLVGVLAWAVIERFLVSDIANANEFPEDTRDSGNRFRSH